MKKLGIALALVCLMALPLLAAPKNGWEIVRAEYGAGNDWMDVTDRVWSLVQGDSLRFRVDGNVLGAGSLPDRNRTLRLQLKDRNGKSRQRTYRDRQQVNLRISSVYQSGLHVRRAIYGSGNRNSDVTARLNSQIQGQQLNLKVTNQNMGGDPAPGQDKTLTVQYALNGRTSQVVVNEGDTLRLNSSSDQGRLQITRAVYGAGSRWSDVTSRLNSQIEGNQLNLRVNNNTMGGDPAQNQSKTLRVDYTFDGRTSQVVVNEGDTLRLNSSSDQGRLQITRAVYGTAYRTSDVTARLNSQIQGDQLHLQVNNNTMGGDPAPGQDKALTLQYALNGRADQVVVNEGDTLRLPYGIVGELSQRIRCESLQAGGYGRTYCPANTRGGVRLSRRLGDFQCVEGSSWGYDAGGVWVNNGCRAEFEVQRDGWSTSTTAPATIPNGTELSVRTNEVIDSKTATVGQTFSAVVAADVLDTFGAVTIPKGSDAQLVIRSASDGDLVLDVDSLTVWGTKYLVSTGDLEQQRGQGVGANRRTAIMVGGGAAVGTVIGAIVGGGKGAAIGAAVGAGAGLGTQVLTRGKEVRVPAETLLSFRLDQDLRLQAAR